jgi:aminoglycoside phosphotransferase
LSILSLTHHLAFGEKVLVKRYASWDRGEPAREWTVLSALAGVVPDLVPCPVESGVDGDPPWLSMTVLPGAALVEPLDGSQVDGLAAALRRFDPVSCCAIVRERLAGSVRPDGVAGQAVDAALGLPPLPVVEPSIVGHGDPNLANYLWDGVRVRVVDFEDAGASDVAFELATLVEHLSARTLDAELFCARFADLGVDPGRLRLARAWWAAFWLHLLLPGGPSARRNPPGMLDSQAFRLLGLVRAWQRVVV